MWAYPDRVNKKLKLAMSVGDHYRISEILPRHFAKTALACGVSPTWTVTELSKMAEQLPEVASQVMREILIAGMDRQAMSHLLDGINKQCAAARRALFAEAKAKTAPKNRGPKL